MPHPPDGAAGGRILLQVPGPSGRVRAGPAGVFSQRCEQPQLVLVGAGEVLLADVVGIGEHGAQLRPDPGCGQLILALIQQRVEQGVADGVLGRHRAGDDLVCGDDGLAVVPGHVAFLVAHHPHAGVGDVGPRLGAGPVGARLIAGAAAAAPCSGRRGRVPGLLLSPLRIVAGLVLGG